MLTIHYYLDPSGKHDKLYQIACDFARELAKKEARFDEVLLLCREDKKISDIQKELEQEPLERFNNGIRFSGTGPLFIIRSLREYLRDVFSTALLIACGLDTGDLFKLGDKCRASVIIAVPDEVHDIEQWIKTWDPREISGAEPVVKSYPLPSCVIKVGLDEMMERGYAKEKYMENEYVRFTIQSLTKHHPEIDGNEVKAYLMRKGSWPETEARKVKDYIDLLKVEKRFSRSDDPEMILSYQRWRQACINRQFPSFPFS
ncbi:MAG: hypothetical protein P4L51_28320 [Puia sp.]|nr:hypothetical protein [Puia sp.]